MHHNVSIQSKRELSLFQPQWLKAGLVLQGAEEKWPAALAAAAEAALAAADLCTAAAAAARASDR